jgi:hypothetical protein
MRGWVRGSRIGAGVGDGHRDRSEQRSADAKVDRGLVVPANVELALLDPQILRHLWIVAANLLDEAVGVLATDEQLELDAEATITPRLTANAKVPTRSR